METPTKPQIILKLGDCIEVMKTLPDNSVDAVICDPPYDLTSIQNRFGKEDSAPAQFGKDGSFARLSKGFMGKTWDGTGIAFKPDTWKEVYRVLKYGGHLLAFGGTRTYHRMACAIEDAGFEIRDCIEWVYGSGFPKSLDISKQIDKMAGAKREVIGTKLSGIANKEEGVRHTVGASKCVEVDITKPATFQPEKWQGYGTAIKPSHEPIVLARKPLSEKNVALNCLKWGTGGINVDGCRIGVTEEDKYDLEKRQISKGKPNENVVVLNNSNIDLKHGVVQQGRFPANLIHDGSDEVIKEFPMVEDEDDEHIPTKQKTLFGDIIEKQLINASRFFYVAKAGKEERDLGCEKMEEKDGNISSGMAGMQGKCLPKRNNHPTVKPIAIMEYLIKLITPPNKDAVVMDCFMGSGTTGCACAKLGVKFVGIEKEEEYFKIAESRINHYLKQEKLDKFQNGNNGKKETDDKESDGKQEIQNI